MSEELAQSQGVEPEPTVAETGAVEESPTAEETPIAEAQQPQPVDLTKLPEFRSWQAEADRRQEQLRREVEAREKQLQELKQRVDELSLSSLPPDERESFYKTRLAELQAQQEREREQQRQREMYATRARKLLDSLGVPYDHPELVWGEAPSPESYAQLAESAALVAAQMKREGAKDVTEKAEKAARKARVEALNEAGVTKTTSAAPTASNDTLLKQYKEELARVKRQRGHVSAGQYASIRAKYRKLGLQL